MKCIYCNSEVELTSSDIITYAITGAKLTKSFVCKTHNAFILCDTDLIDFSDDDFDYGEADIQEADEERTAENRADDEDEDECLKHEECSDCPYFCPMCGECRLEDED